MRAYTWWAAPLLAFSVLPGLCQDQQLDLDALFATPTAEEKAKAWEELPSQPENGSMKVGAAIRTSPTWSAFGMTYQSGELELPGIVILPERRGTHPVLIVNHDGLNGLVLDARYTALAHEGYVVVASAFRGQPAAGQPPAGDIEVARGEVDDALALMAACKELKAADPKRIGMLGAGHGAWVTNLALLRAKGLLAAVSLYGVSDCFDAEALRPLVEQNLAEPPKPEASPLTHLLEWWLIGPLREKKLELAQARAEMVRRSPVYFAEHAQCPVLLLHGEDDQVVPVSQSTRWADALQQAGKPVELKTFAGQGYGFDHWPTDDAREAWQIIMTFLGEHVLHAGEKPPREASPPAATPPAATPAPEPAPPAETPPAAARPRGAETDEEKEP